MEVTLEDVFNTALSGRVVCRWFNQHYLQRMLAAGQELIVFGRPKQYRNRIYLDHPEFEIVEEEGEENIHMGRITPIYPLTEGVRQRALRVDDVSGHSGTSGAATESHGPIRTRCPRRKRWVKFISRKVGQLRRRRERSSRWRNLWRCRSWWNDENVRLRP